MIYLPILVADLPGTVPALWVGLAGVDDALINLLTGTTSAIHDAGKIHVELHLILILLRVYIIVSVSLEIYNMRIHCTVEFVPTSVDIL